MKARTRILRAYLLILAAIAALFAALPAVAQQPAGKPVVQNPHGDLPYECTECHSAEGWKPAKVSKDFVHAPKTFPLVGAHATAKCMGCHTSLDFKHASTRCADCHKDIHRGELGTDCGRCHTPRNFLDRSVMQKLHQTTRFALTGAHLMADCQSCHAPLGQGHLSFINVPTECGACHLPAYQATASMGGSVPPHATAGFSTQCEQCHITVGWQQAQYNHASSGFALTGAHIKVACSACHANGYANLQTTCVSCHLVNYNNTTNPSHASAGFPTDCAACHPVNPGWAGANFNHTSFPSNHGHSTCAQCHPVDFNTFSCRGCHGDKHNKGYTDTQCLSCHQGGGGGGG